MLDPVSNPSPCRPTAPSVLVSACLLGQVVRYNAVPLHCAHPVLARWQAQGRVLAVCPEMAGGLPTPRPPAEIQGGQGGLAVLTGQAMVRNVQGYDVTQAFVHGAQQALTVAQALGIRLAVLKEGSPSCGSGYTYDGGFRGVKVAHPGVTAACLRQAGIQVFNEHQWDDARRYLDSLG